MPVFTAALLQAVHPEKVQQAQRAEHVPSSILAPSPAPARPSHHPLPICLLPFFFFFNLPPAHSLFYILWGSMHLSEPPSLLHPSHHLTTVRGQKLACSTLNLSTAVRVQAGAAMPAAGMGNIPRAVQIATCGGSILFWSLAMLTVVYPRFKYTLSVSCGANLATTAELRGARGKAKVIYHNTTLGYITVRWLIWVGEKKDVHRP